MKVLYIIDQNIDEGKTAGIIYKIQDKISAWSNMGLEVQVLSLYSFKLYNSQFNEIEVPYTFNLKPHGRYFTLIRLMYSTMLLLLFLRKNKYDLLYIRQRPYMPFTKMALSKHKVVIEINTDDEEEYKSLSGLMYKYNSFTRNIFYKLASGFVSVTNNLAEKYKHFSSNTLVLANGVDTKEYPLKNSKNEKPVLCFVGSPGFSWHGIDKIEYIATELPEYQFKLIGIEGNNSENLTYLGYLSLDKVKEEVLSSDIGICTLSLHNKNMDEACPLKSRQYLAQGLPIIYAYDDTDLNGDEEFALKLPNTRDNIELNIDKIKEFVEFAFNNEQLVRQARDFAEKKLDSNIKEKLRVKYLKVVAGSVF